MEVFRGKRIKYNNRIFRIQSVLQLKDHFSILGFYEKGGIIPPNSHIVELKLSKEHFMRLVGEAVSF